MESPNSTEPDKPIEPAVQPASSIDTSQLFQKDPEPVVSSPKRNPLARLGRKKLLILAVLIVFVLMGGGLALAHFNESSNQPATQQASEEVVNTTSVANNDGTTDNTTDKIATNNSSTPSASSTPQSTNGTSTTNTSSGGNTSTGGGSSGGSSSSGGTTTTSPKTYAISYTSNCYSPANVTIKQGDTVKFTNNSTKSMWPASDNHPSHTIYPEFDAKNSIAQGGTYSFKFEKIGSWGYHDHIKPNCDGTITVQ